jgi:hypothetical protein
LSEKVELLDRATRRSAGPELQMLMDLGTVGLVLDAGEWEMAEPRLHNIENRMKISPEPLIGNVSSLKSRLQLKSVKTRIVAGVDEGERLLGQGESDRAEALLLEMQKLMRD